MHTCEALVISCIDFRFQEHLRQFLNQRHFKSYDLICLAGAAKNLAAKQSNLALLLKQIGLSHKLHQIKTIYLINHQNCGAYGALIESGSRLERALHRQDLIKGQQIIQKKFKNLKVKLYFMEFKKDPLEKVVFTAIK